MELQIGTTLQIRIMFLYLKRFDPFEKLELESKFQKLSPGGAISYVECAVSD